MARPRGRSKTARLTVNLEPREYEKLCALAREKDVPLSWLTRRAINAFLSGPRADDNLDGLVAIPTPPQTRRAER